ncbi:MAG: DUF4065 domain-containing protein [Pseudobdellovibrio sp.]|nr:DUF4065 domain-containing protein [Pseudobdellovibrio sp.]
MKCVKCGSKKFETKQERASVEIKGEQIDYIADMDVCANCGLSVASDDQMHTSYVNASDAYRKKHQLLTSTEIIVFRSNMNMTQEQFAEYLGVGVASLKRWENGSIQEKANDELIRLKCSEEKLNEQLYDLESHVAGEIYRGYRQYDFEAFANVVVSILNAAPSPLFFFKVLFYVDFLSFKRNGKSITGLMYSAMQYGPCPSYYRKLKEDLISAGWVERSGMHNLVALKKFTPTHFTKSELSIIQEINEMLAQKGARYFYDGSHEEPAWKNTAEDELISYSMSQDLRLIQ